MIEAIYVKIWKMITNLLPCDRQDRINLINVQTPGERNIAQRKVCLLEESDEPGEDPNCITNNDK